MTGGNFLTPKKRQILVELYAERAAAVERLLTDYTLSNVQSDPVLKAFFDNTRSPRGAVIDYLTKNKQVSVAALMHDGDGGGLAIGEACVEIDNGRFEFVTPGVRALVVVARDEGDMPCDLIAWAPNTGSLASYFGRVAVLGLHVLDDIPLGEPVRMHRDFLAWLRAGRQGLLLLNRKAAWRSLVDTDIAVDNIEYGTELRKVLRPPMPRISVPASACERGA